MLHTDINHSVTIVTSVKKKNNKILPNEVLFFL